MQLTQATLDRLACPVCFAPLHLFPDHIDCTACHRRYPILDGLPILIESRAIIPAPPARKET